MKKLLVFFIILVFALLCTTFNGTTTCYASELNKYAIVHYETQTYELSLDCNNCSTLRTDINNMCKADQLKIIEKILKMGFSLQQALCYVYPNLESSISQIDNSVYKQVVEPLVVADDNNCKIMFKNAENGQKLNKNLLFEDFYKYLVNGIKINANIETLYPENTLEDLKSKFVLVSEFSTSFANSSAARKNNITVACGAINGVLIKSGETFSFNAATGVRSLEKGYQTAKIIENGKYVDGVGGGVCQVSTTLYNACILAGLNATEVHNHSLPTGYVDPGFDAMVSSGASDLKIKNNTNYDYLITTSSNQNMCQICIYGVKPEYRIVTRYNKYQTIDAGEDIVETDSNKYNKDYGVGIHRISDAVSGYKAKAYLDYYKDDVLIKSEMIRDNTYKARPGVVLIIEGED